MRKRFAAWTLIIAFLGVIYAPVLFWLFRSWLNNPYYEHGFLIPIVSGFAAWRQRHVLKRAQQSSIGAVLFLAGLAVYIVSFAWEMRFPAAFSLLMVLAGLVIYFYGSRAGRSMAFPICLLLFAIPIPYLSDIGSHMQHISSQGTAVVVQTIGITIERTGSEIRLADSAFIIGMPCAGMNTLISLMALAAVLAYFIEGPYHKKAILFAMSLPIAIMANIFRISFLLLVANHWGAKAAEGVLHDLSSLLFFLLAFLCLLLLGRILGLGFGINTRGKAPKIE
ncbi:exosortase/archaeosortase family protein [Chloroflexota bacterium]